MEESAGTIDHNARNTTKLYQLLCVIRLSGVSWSRPDPRVLHSQELLRGKVLLVAVAPQLIPDLKVRRV